MSDKMYDPAFKLGDDGGKLEKILLNCFICPALTARLIGYSDISARIDPLTFRRIPWENNAPFFLVDFYNPITNKPFELCPRGLLKRVVGECEGMGLKALCGMEFEWYNFKGLYLGLFIYVK